ncbi:unnamed protein product [Camellia sinensis]
MGTSTFDCYNTGNFTTNSTYGKNRDIALSSIASNVTANGGFYTATIGHGSDTVYALELCRPNLLRLSIPLVSPSSRTVPTKKKPLNGDPLGALYDAQTSPFSGNNMDEFDWALNSLVDSLVSKASIGSSRLKFASGKKNFTEYENIYALMMCTPDLSSGDCRDCLRGAVGDYQSCCNRKLTIDILKPSCVFQYKLYHFLESTADASPPPPPPPLAVIFAPSLLTPSTNTTKEDNRSATFQIVIIVVVPISFLLVVITLDCAFFQLTKSENFQRLTYWVSDIVERLDSGHPSKMAWIRTASKLFMIFRRGGVHHADEDASQSVDSFQLDFATIRAATNNFSSANKLGEGGFGFVYKGKLSIGQEIAVKQLRGGSQQGEVEFKNEIVSMAKLHKNLVRLLGFCFKGKERLLIYEFVPNASLDRFIFDPTKQMLLNWETRYKIIVGIARGFLYLHEDSQLKIIHRELKASNVLLDGAMNPKLQILARQGCLLMIKVEAKQKELWEPSNGKKNGHSSREEHIDHLPSYAWNKWMEGKSLSLIDQTLWGGSKSKMMGCIRIGLLCVQDKVAKRPTMASIVLMLTCLSISLPLPSKPGFFIQSSIQPHMSLSNQFPSSANLSLERPVNLSINEASITEPWPR